MDLDALRKAALSSKKRRRTPQPQAPDDPDEREEGEIDDDQPDPSTSLPPADDLYREHDHYNPYYDPHRDPYYHQADLTAPSSSTAAALAATKDETKRVIAELLTWGVSPDYLLSIGVSRDALETSFYELGLDISLPPAHGPPFAPYSPFPSTSTSLSANARPFTPRTSSSPAPSAELAALEALKRQELFARKAALTARNAQSAQSFESALDDLFSASTSTDPNSSTAEAPAAISKAAAKKKAARKRANAKKRKLSGAGADELEPTSPAQRTHDLRDAIDHTEELVDMPDGGPFAASTSASSSTSTMAAGSRSIAAASTRPSSAFAADRPSQPALRSSSRARPLATDFEAEPATRLAPVQHGGGLGNGHGRGGAYAAGMSGTGYLPSLAMLGNGEGSMIIDLSDSEDDEDEDGGAAGRCDAGEQNRASSGEGLEAPGARSGGGGSKAPSPAPPIVDAAEVERKRRLEEKEHEIERMMARIAEMERKKQALREKKGAVGRQVQPSTPEVEAAPAAVGAIEQVVDEPAAEREGEDVAMEDEAHESAPESAQEDEQPLRVEVDEPAREEPLVEVRILRSPFLPPELELSHWQSQDRPTPPPTSVFRPYTSSLARFPLIRASAADPDPAGSSSSADDAGNAGLASWVARKHGVNASKRLCKAEAGGGKCHDAKCRSVHAASFEPTAAELAEYQSLRLPSQPQSSSATTPNANADRLAADAA
ncbi:hypothetical protein JCM9279_005189 [Rhodotorula babjevae]